MAEKFHILASFEFPADVQVLKAKLESEGIPVFLKDEHTLNSDPLISNAIGGVRVQVYNRDKERAMAIYDEIRPFALDDQGNPVTCPNCGAQKSEVYYSRKGLFYKLFPFFEKRKYKCLNCGMITKPE